MAPVFRGPCDFKGVCKKCNWTKTEDRPTACVTLKCEYYTPCIQCKNNRKLNEVGMCGDCAAKPSLKSSAKMAEIKRSVDKKVTVTAPVKKDDVLSDGQAALLHRRDTTLTAPGTPPPELSKAECDYYRKRWKDYSGYYRDPAASFCCHLIILEEINLTNIARHVIGNDGSLKVAWEKKKETSVNMIATLNKQLPTKEAEEESDYERCMSGIYEGYLKEKGINTLGGMQRVIRNDTQLLAPVLPFSMNPAKLLRDCGFEEVEVQEATEMIKDLRKEEGVTPKEVLKFFGFHLDEKYAEDYDPGEENELVAETSVSEEDTEGSELVEEEGEEDVI